MTPDSFSLLGGAGAAFLSLAVGCAAAQLSGPLSCAWPARPDELLRRLREVKKARKTGKARSVLGAILLTSFLTSGAVIAYAAQPSVPERLPNEVIGVVGSGDRLSLQVKIDDAVKTLGPGDDYRDGWTLKAVTASTATLTKDGDSRVVGLNPAGAVQQAAKADVTKVNVVGEAMQAAIDAGDVARIMQMGGSPMDVINAQRAILAKNPNALFTPTSTVPLSRWMASTEQSLAEGLVPVFIHEGQRNMMASQFADGHLDRFTSVPGMNEPGAAQVGIEHHVKTPAEIEAEVNARRVAAGLPPGPSLSAMFAAGRSGAPPPPPPPPPGSTPANPR